METIRISVHHFVTAITIVLTLTALILSSLAISGHIDYRDNSIKVEALDIPSGYEQALVSSTQLSNFNAIIDEEIDGLAGTSALITVTQEDLAHLAGHSSEAISATAHVVIDTDGLALKSGSGNYTKLKTHNNVTSNYTLTFPASVSAGVLSTDATGNITMGTVSGATKLQDLNDGDSGAAHSIKHNEQLTFGTSTGKLILDSAADTELDAVNIILDASADITLDADGGEIFLKDGGTNFGALVQTGNELVIKSGTTPTTAMTFAGADVTHAGSVTVTTDLTVSGSDITLGNGSNSSIKNEVTAHNVAGKTMTITAGSTTAGTTDDIAGGSLTIQGGQGKGTGSGGDIIFQVANSSTTGNTLNAYATALTISDDKKATFDGAGEFTGALTANSGITVANAALTINNQAITQNTGGQVTFAGNVDANGGLDVTGASLNVGGGYGSTGVTVTDAGNIQANGTLTVDSTSTFSDTVTVGADAAGRDVKFFGETTTAYMMWDHTNDQLELVNAAGSTGEPLLYIDNNDTGNALKIDSATTTGSTVHITNNTLTTGSGIHFECSNTTHDTRNFINLQSATDTVTATGTLTTTYPAHIASNGVHEGWIKMAWTNTLTAAAHTTSVRLPEGNTFITHVMVIVTTATGAGQTANFGLTDDPDGILVAVSLNAVGLQSDYTDAIRGVYAANSGDNVQVYWNIPDSITGANRNLVLTLSATGTAGHILIKYVNIVA